MGLCDFHRTSRRSRSMESGISSHVWSSEELCNRLPENHKIAVQTDKGQSRMHSENYETTCCDMRYYSFAGCAGSGSGADQCHSRSVDCQPEKFDAKLIRVIGFLRLEFEGNVLYLHREDYENAILGDGIWVDATPAIMKQKATLNMTTFYSKAFSVRVIEGTWVCGAGPSNKSVALNSGDL